MRQPQIIVFLSICGNGVRRWKIDIAYKIKNSNVKLKIYEQEKDWVDKIVFIKCL